MSCKCALVFDTNFIIQNQKLDKVLAMLQEDYVPYVPQVSVEERIAQQCRELKRKFDSISKTQDDLRGIASVKAITTYEQKAAGMRVSVQAAYNKTFGENIIPLLKDEKTYAEILDRAFMKIPPFLSDERIDGKTNGKSPSDKGFKDALIWLSMLCYFKEQGENNILFLTDDNGFRNQAEQLCEEFKRTTGKDIVIKENAYIREISQKDDPPQEVKPTPKEAFPDVRQLRERISTVVNAICGFETEGDWGETIWIRYFTINDMVDINYISTVLSGLNNVISKYLFNQTVPAYNVLALDDRVTNGDYAIPIIAIEDLAKLYDDMQKRYPHNMQQFYSTVANIINQNYMPSKITHNIFDDNLPF